MAAGFNTNASALQHPLMSGGGVQAVFGNQNASDEEEEE